MADGPRQRVPEGSATAKALGAGRRVLDGVPQTLLQQRIGGLDLRPQKRHQFFEESSRRVIPN